jgi:hypothetical protein
VAIVGSSANLLNAKQGRLIDTFDNVIRFNRAEVSDKYSDYAGTKTTLRVVNNHVFDNIDIIKQGYTNSPKKFVKKLRNTNILYVGPDEGPWSRRKKNTHKSNNLFKFNYSELEQLKQYIQIETEKNFQVGTIMTVLCVSSNIKPHLFGFDLTKQKRTHYYQNRPAEPNYEVHSPNIEMEAIKNLAENRKINIY